MSIVGSLSKSQPHKSKLVTSQSWSELGTAQPQLVFFIIIYILRFFLSPSLPNDGLSVGWEITTYIKYSGKVFSNGMIPVAVDRLIKKNLHFR